MPRGVADQRHKDDEPDEEGGGADRDRERDDRGPQPHRRPVADRGDD